MSLFDNEHPQHLAHLARAKAASRRTTEMLDAADRTWRPPETAPRDGSKFTVLYDDGSTEDEVYWSDERYCMLGAPQGSWGPGFVSTEAGNLPVGDCPDITHWRTAQHDGGAGVDLSGIAREQHSELQSDGSDRTHFRSPVNSAGRPEGDSLPTNSCTGIAEAKAAAAIHWKNKRRAA